MVLVCHLFSLALVRIPSRTDTAGNVKSDKEKSTEKIDDAVATIMGLDRAICRGNHTAASGYDGREIYSYKNGTLVFHTKALLMFIHLNL